jgi:hypothetical protein
MGTRCLTKFIEEGKEICVLYRQFDGYPEGHGKELAEFLKNMPIVNGYGDDTIKQANGMGCLAAQVVAHFKTKVGGFYLYPAKTSDIGEEFVYSVSGKPGDNEATIEVTELDWGGEKSKVLMKGKASDVLIMCASWNEEQ